MTESNGRRINNVYCYMSQKQFDQDLFKAEIISIERNIEKMKKENDELVRIIFL